VSPLGPFSWSRLWKFKCPSCAAQKAYRSRYRGILERIFLLFLMLKPVRCDRCYHRSYAFRTVPVLEPGARAGKLNNQSVGDSSADERVA